MKKSLDGESKQKKEGSDRIIPVTGGRSHNLAGIHESLIAINDFSAGIGYALGAQLDNYTAVIDAQRTALDSVSSITDSINIPNVGIENIYDDMVSPLSSVIADVGILNSNINNLTITGKIAEEYKDSIASFSGLAIDFVKEQQLIINNSLDGIDLASLTTLAENISPSVQAVSYGLNETIRSLGVYPEMTEAPLPELDTVQEEGVEVGEKDVQEYQTRLDELLRDINPDLVIFRQGAWTAFGAKKEDYIGQASSSMRRLVDSLLRDLAPHEEVEKTEYFKNSVKAKGNNGRPTRKARVFYIVNWDAEKAAHLERLTRGFLEAYDNLSAWDHVPLDKDAFVHGTLIVIEGHLLSLLSTRTE